MASKIGWRDICIIVTSPLIMNGPIFREMNSPYFKSVVYLILALTGLKVGEGEVYTKEIFLWKN